MSKTVDKNKASNYTPHSADTTAPPPNAELTTGFTASATSTVAEMAPSLLKPHPRHSSIYGTEGTADLEQLIIEHGWLCNHNIVATTDKRIISGHRIHKAALQLGLPQVPVVIREFGSPQEELAALLLHNHTRTKTNEQKLREGQIWEEIEAEKAQHRQKAGIKLPTSAAPCGQGQISSANIESSGNCVKGRTSDLVAQQIDLGSGDSYERGKKVLRSIDALKTQGQVEDARALRHILNNDSIGAAAKLAKMPEATRTPLLRIIAEGRAKSVVEAKTVRFEDNLQQQKDELEKNPPQLPAGTFDVIAIDPPWPYGIKYNPGWGRAACPYPEMSLEEIRAEKIPAADDCILFLWITNSFLRHGYSVLDEWGFREVGVITWVKGDDEDHVPLGMGTWLRNQTEHIIMAVKGQPHSAINLTNQGTVLYGERREHSRKPESFYALVESLCPGTRKLEYFSRTPREGWTVFGNDTEKFTSQDQLEGNQQGGADDE